MGRPRIDLTNQTFGRLKVISFAGNVRYNKPAWHCLCLCGNTIIVASAALKASGSTSCGCRLAEVSRSIKKDIIGRRYGKLIVLERAENTTHTKQSKVQYKCLCVCGKETIARQSRLESGDKISCGCAKLARLSDAQRKENRRPHAHNHRVRKRNLPSCMTTESFSFMMDYWSNACAMCGNIDSQYWTIADDHWIPLADIENCPGGTPWNILPLCHSKKGSASTGIKCCNNSKNKKDPIIWLIERFGYDIAEAKLSAIEAYFALAKEKFPS